jgi:hypothetical protein
MYNTLLRMWKNGRLTEAQLDKAVALGWITEEQKATIMATPKNK